MSEHQPTELPPTPALRAQAWLAVAVLTAIMVAVMLLMAFSTRNTPMSIDGDKAQYSRNIQSDSD